MNIVCKFSNVSERDMDLLFLEEFVVSKEFLNIFISKAGITNAAVVEVEQSKVDAQFGESDMTVIVETEGKRHGLLIEDKIDAIAMPNQYERYIERGEIGVLNGDYNTFDVFIVAPEKYLKENDVAKKYPNKVSYEECEAYFEENIDSRKLFKLFQIRDAIYKQKTGYQVVENKNVTDFWHKYILFQREKYQHLFLTATEGPRGSKAVWPRFNTVIKELYILHKSEVGYVDLTISGAAERLYQLEVLLNDMVNIKKLGISIQRTGKAAALRINVPKLDFKKPFEIQKADVEFCFNAVEKLSNLVKELNAERIHTFIKNN